jgi:hypothetical protein
MSEDRPQDAPGKGEEPERPEEQPQQLPPEEEVAEHKLPPEQEITEHALPPGEQPPELPQRPELPPQQEAPERELPESAGAASEQPDEQAPPGDVGQTDETQRVEAEAPKTDAPGPPPEDAPAQAAPQAAPLHRTTREPPPPPPTTEQTASPEDEAIASSAERAASADDGETPDEPAQSDVEKRLRFRFGDVAPITWAGVLLVALFGLIVLFVPPLRIHWWVMVPLAGVAAALLILRRPASTGVERTIIEAGRWSLLALFVILYIIMAHIVANPESLVDRKLTDFVEIFR